MPVLMVSEHPVEDRSETISTGTVTYSPNRPAPLSPCGDTPSEFTIHCITSDVATYLVAHHDLTGHAPPSEELGVRLEAARETSGIGA